MATLIKVNPFVGRGEETAAAYLGVSADEVASWAHTISYEIVCGVGPRVPRVYLDSAGRVPQG